MNQIQIIGNVSFPFGEDNTKKQNTRVLPNGNKVLTFNVWYEGDYLLCKTFNEDLIDTLWKGDMVELTSYKPKKRVSPKYKIHYLEVYKLRILKKNRMSEDSNEYKEKKEVDTNWIDEI